MHFQRHTLEQHSVDMRQFIDFRESTLANGMRVIDAHNSSGLCFTLLPDRGLDIWAAAYNGTPLTWLSAGSPHPSDYGASWLRLFNGGLLTTCGLTHAGPPETDDLTGEQRDIHGNYTRLRADVLAKEGAWADDHTYHLRLTGEVHEGRLFGEQLHLRRTYTLTLGQPRISLQDTVTNQGDQPAPLMLLYHCNVGYPLVQAGTQFVTNSDVVPRDDEARTGLETWDQYTAAQPGYKEQVFFHHVRAPEAALLNDNIGLTFVWENLPYLTQWKNTRQGIYVSGVEPGNCIPEGQNAARRAGRLVMLQPGEAFTCALSLTVLDGAAAVQACRARITQQRETHPLMDGYDLNDYS
ncbi:MAG: aldose 1-epimerase family protein [Anaerolineae bacterium]